MFTRGEVVHLLDASGTPCARSAVVHAGMDEDSGLPVVILRDNTVWVGVDGGKEWSYRDARWYRGRRLYRYDEARDNQLEVELIRARLKVVTQRLDDLSEQSKRNLSRVMRKLTSELREVG